MTSAVLFLVFISVMNGCLSAPAEIKNQTDGITDAIPGPKLNLKTPVLHGDVAVPTTLTRNADPCAFKGCKWPKSGRYVRIPITSHQTSVLVLSGSSKEEQYISLEKNQCVYFSTVQHELLHALGFNHEQVRSDRDNYVRILFSNIQQKQRYNFEKVRTNNLGTPYDFGSVMHYHNYAFTSNGLPTIEAKSNPNLIFGNAREMSSNDIARVNKLYRCNGSSRRPKRMHPDVLH